MTTRVRLTYEDYAALPDDGRRYELHEGELSVTPSRALGQVFLAPVDCVFENVTVVQPDIVFVETARRSIISGRGIEGAPTLAIEIISPSSVGIDRRRKLHLYARYGVPSCWIVDPPAKTIEAYALTQGEYRVVGTLAGTAVVALPPFPDLRLDPAEIWPRDLPPG
jgi:Uma2 family endonuclease